jgi:ribosome-binding factor A
VTTIRQERVSQLLFQELSVLISGELADPRLSLISVTEVVVSRDLRSARVFVHRDEEDLPRRELLAGLRAATPFLRRELAIRCALRVVPELNFVYDETPERAARIEELLRQIADERLARDGETDDTGDTGDTGDAEDADIADITNSAHTARDADG